MSSSLKMFFAKMPFAQWRHNIEIRFNAINIMTSIVLVSLLIAFAYYLIVALSDDVAQDYAELYSFKTTAVLNSQINRDLGILTSAAYSLPIVQWFADEHNDAKRENAFHAMKTYSAVLNSGIIYFGKR